MDTASALIINFEDQLEAFQLLLVLKIISKIVIKPETFMNEFWMETFLWRSKASFGQERESLLMVRVHDCLGGELKVAWLDYSRRQRLT